MWDGILSPRPEWENSNIKILPDELITTFEYLKKKIIANLIDNSIICSEGYFVPNKALETWQSIHDGYCNQFESTRNLLISSSDGMRDIAKSAVAICSVQLWQKSHPAELPPPSNSVYASNLAVSLIPNKEDFYGLYQVTRRVNAHSFCFMFSDPRSLFIKQGEKRFLAWQTIDELVAGNVRRLIRTLQPAFLKKRMMGNRIRNVLSGSKQFLATDILLSSCLRDKVQCLLDTINSKTVDQVDRNLFGIALHEAKELAIKLSTVSGVIT